MAMRDETGPDAPNLIVLQENGSFLKLIDYSEVSDNGANYDLQGEFDIKQDQLLARISKPSGEVYTDVYTVKQMADGNMQMTHTVNNTDKHGYGKYALQLQHAGKPILTGKPALVQYPVRQFHISPPDKAGATPVRRRQVNLSASTIPDTFPSWDPARCHVLSRCQTTEYFRS